MSAAQLVSAVAAWFRAQVSEVTLEHAAWWGLDNLGEYKLQRMLTVDY